MKKIVTFELKFFYFLILIMALQISCQKDATVESDNLTKPGEYDISVEIDSKERWFKVIVPPNYNDSNKHPALLTYHGGNLSMGFMYKNRKDLVQRCEEENWILVFPNGANINDDKGSGTWNAIHCCNPAWKLNIDDIGFTKEIVATIVSKLNIDTDRIYAMGGSNGGMLVHKLATELPDIFAAVAENQGTVGGRDEMDQIFVAEPEKPIPFMLIHGKSDVTVKFNGGWSSSSDRYDNSFGESVSLWADNNGCEAIPDTTLINGLNGKVWIIDYDDCINDSDVRAIVIENKGHGWPGLEESGFDGSNASIDFLKEHSK